VRQLLPAPVTVDRHSAAGQECRCFGRNAVFVLRLEAEQRFAILVAAQRENREDETSAVLNLNNRSYFVARRPTPCMKPSAQSVPMTVPSASLHRIGSKIPFAISCGSTGYEIERFRDC